MNMIRKIVNAVGVFLTTTLRDGILGRGEYMGGTRGELSSECFPIWADAHHFSTTQLTSTPAS